MHVKTFESLTLKDALRQIKDEFGSHAVIINTKTKGLDEDPHSKVFEVTAAVPETRTLNGGSGGPVSVDALRAEISRTSIQQMEKRIEYMAEHMLDKEQLRYLENGVQELKLMLTEALGRGNPNSNENIPGPLVPLFTQLKLTGLSDTHLASLMKYLKGLPSPVAAEKKKAESAEEFYRSQAIRWMLGRIKISPKWSPVAGSCSVQAFIGTTGSGKTSAVAKLASHFHKKAGVKVCIISFDTLRLAATEQLRIYAKVIGVPFDVASTSTELSEMIEKNASAEMIFIDTGGRSPRNTELIDSLKSLSENAIPIDKHLVLSVTEKESQLDHAIRGFSPVGIQSLIFSKLDETWSFGEIFNLSTKWTLPLSYFSTGCSVPEHIERATRERVVERIFGL